MMQLKNGFEKQKKTYLFTLMMSLRVVIRLGLLADHLEELLNNNDERR